MVSPEESLPRFNENYRYAQSAFFEQFNDVDFFVEDEESENFYFLIFSKLFPNVRLENVHPLCGKANAIEHSKRNSSPRKSVYLLDKDFDDLLGILHKQQNVFYLEKYCIENYLMEEEALIGLIIGAKIKLKPRDVRANLRFQSELDEIIGELSNLYALFFLVQKHRIQAPNTSQTPECFCSSKSKCSLDKDKVYAYRSLIRRRAKQQALDVDLDKELKRYSTTFELGKRNGLYGQHVSGRFILHLFWQRISKAFGLESVSDLNTVAYQLAKECTFNSLAGLKKKVDVYVKAA
jgi:Protein of unknown function (DUF4435)